MNENATRNTFWLRILDLADAAKQDELSRQQLLDILSGLEEGYEDAFDPADAFNEYVVLNLCRAIRPWLDTRQP